MSHQKTTNNGHHAMAHCHAFAQNDSGEDSDVPMTRLLTCYAYEETMVVDVNQEMVDYTSVDDDDDEEHAHHHDAQHHRPSLPKYGSSQTAAAERNMVVSCPNMKHADSEHKSRHKYFMNSSDHTELNKMVQTSKDHHCSGHRKSSYESHSHHHSKHYDPGSKHNSRHRSSHKEDSLYAKESAHQKKHKTNSNDPKENNSRLTRDDLNQLLLNVEFEVDSSSSTRAAMEDMDIEGVVNVNTSVCKPERLSNCSCTPIGKSVKGSSHGAVGGHTHNGRKRKTASQMDELDVCIESSVMVTYNKKNDPKNRHVEPHGKQHHRKRPSKIITKNGSVVPVVASASLATDKSLNKKTKLDSELELSFEFLEGNNKKLTFTKECSKGIRKEGTVVENKVGKTHSKMDQGNANSHHTRPKSKSRNILEGYGQTVIVKTKSSSAGKRYEHKSNTSHVGKVKTMHEKPFASEPVLKQRSLMNDEDTYLRNKYLSQSVSDGWNRGKATTDHDFGIRDSTLSDWKRRASRSSAGIRASTSSDWNRRESRCSEREAGIRNSFPSSLYRREPMSEIDARIRASASRSSNRREYTSDRESGLRDSVYHSSNRREPSMSERESGIRASASGSSNRRESMSKEGIWNKGPSLSGWDIKNSIPIEQDCDQVDRVLDDFGRPCLPDVDVGLKYSTTNTVVPDDKEAFGDKMYPSLEDMNISVEDDGEKYSTATSGDGLGLDNFQDINTENETKEYPSKVWDIDTIPEEEGIGVVDPPADDWNSKEYITDEYDLGTEPPVAEDVNAEESVQKDVGPEIHSNQDNPDAGSTKLVLDDNNKNNKDKPMQADSNPVKEDPVLTPTKGEATQDSGIFSIVDNMLDYLKRGIFLSSEDDHQSRRRNRHSRRIGRDVQSEVGGIDAGGIANDNKDQYEPVSDSRGNGGEVNYETLDRVPSFRSTLDETTTLVSRPQRDGLWNTGHTTVYLGDRITYCADNREMCESDSSSSENVQSNSTGHNMLDEVSAILKKIDTPYISTVGSNIRNRSDNIPSSHQGSGYWATPSTNVFSSGSFVPVGEFGMSSKMEQPVVVEKTSFLHKIFSALGALKSKFSFNKTKGSSQVNETVSPISDRTETNRYTASDKSLQIPMSNGSSEIAVEYMTSREQFRQPFTYGSDPRLYGNNFGNGSMAQIGENNFYPNYGPHPFSRTYVPIDERKPTVDSLKTRNRKIQVNLDSELNKKSSGSEQSNITVSSETIHSSTSRSGSNKHSSESVVESVSDDSQSSSSEESSSVSEAESVVQARTSELASRMISSFLSSTTGPGTKEDRMPFQGIRGYPRRLYPISLYCLCIVLVYLFWTACYFNCTYTSYGLVRRSNVWYCKLYRLVKDSSNYTPELPQVGYGKLYHPFRPW